EARARKRADDASLAKEQALLRAEGHRLTAQSSVALPNNPGLALLLALKGAQRGEPRRAAHKNALLAGLRATRRQRTLVGDRVRFTSARFSRDGRRVLTTAVPSRPLWPGTALAQVWEADTGRVALTIAMPGLAFGDVDLSPDGSRLVTAFLGAVDVRYQD